MPTRGHVVPVLALSALALAGCFTNHTPQSSASRPDAALHQSVSPTINRAESPSAPPQLTYTRLHQLPNIGGISDARWTTINNGQPIVVIVGANACIWYDPAADTIKVVPYVVDGQPLRGGSFKAIGTDRNGRELIASAAEFFTRELVVIDAKTGQLLHRCDAGGKDKLTMTAVLKGENAMTFAVSAMFWEKILLLDGDCKELKVFGQDTFALTNDQWIVSDFNSDGVDELLYASGGTLNLADANGNLLLKSTPVKRANWVQLIRCNAARDPSTVVIALTVPGFLSSTTADAVGKFRYENNTWTVDWSIHSANDPQAAWHRTLGTPMSSASGNNRVLVSGKGVLAPSSRQSGEFWLRWHDENGNQIGELIIPGNNAWPERQGKLLGAPFGATIADHALVFWGNSIYRVDFNPAEHVGSGG